MSRIIVDAIRNSSAGSDGITLSSDGKVTFPNTSTGKVLQIVSTTKTDTASYSNATQSYWNNTDFKVTITPSSASNKILITAVVMVGVDSQQSLYAQLRKDGTVLVQGLSLIHI